MRPTPTCGSACSARPAEGDDVRTTIRPARPNCRTNFQRRRVRRRRKPGAIVGPDRGARISNRRRSRPKRCGGMGMKTDTIPRISACDRVQRQEFGLDQGPEPGRSFRDGAGWERAVPAGGRQRDALGFHKSLEEADDDDEVNPLPPALEPEKVGSTEEPENAPDHAIALAEAPELLPGATEPRQWAEIHAGCRGRCRS